MKRIALTKKGMIWCLICILLSLVSLILGIIRNTLCKSLDTQNMAERWDDSGKVSQVSCFFAESCYMTEDRLKEFEFKLDEKLKEQSIEIDSENESARLWADAYSARGELFVQGEKSSLSLNAIGIGGDFFLFHPLRLTSGNYFSGHNLNDDCVVIDEETAWQLFGACDVAGMMMNVNGVPHLIVGVVERDRDELSKAAGLENPVIYCSMGTLRRNHQGDTINHYEVVMPNPIDGFAVQLVKENLSPEEKNCTVVENTNRFRFQKSLKLVKEFGYRSMNGKAVIYPYWENIARCYEDRIALVTVLIILFAFLPVSTVVILIWYRWKHKKWTVKSLLQNVKIKVSKLHEKRKKRSVMQTENVKIKTYFDDDEE